MTSCSIVEHCAIALAETQKYLPETVITCDTGITPSISECS